VRKFRQRSAQRRKSVRCTELCVLSCLYRLGSRRTRASCANSASPHTQPGTIPWSARPGPGNSIVARSRPLWSLRKMLSMRSLLQTLPSVLGLLGRSRGASGAGTAGRAAPAPGAGPAVGRTLAAPLGALAPSKPSQPQCPLQRILVPHEGHCFTWQGLSRERACLQVSPLGPAHWQSLGPLLRPGIFSARYCYYYFLTLSQNILKQIVLPSIASGTVF
jgi:hypothetical protein